MTAHTFDYDLIVIGSGAGGSVAASIAAREGKRVAIIEQEVFGGDASNWGDVPVKALLHVARVYDEAKHGDRFGLRSNTLSYNYPSIRAWKERAVKQTGVSGNRHYYEKQGISTFEGKAHFLTPHEITVNRRHLSARHFLIATGSSWVAPEIQGLNHVDYFTPRSILESLRPPKSILIVGGGRHGIEIAQLLAIFGTKVYLVEQKSRLMPRLDSEVGEHIEKILTEQRGVTVLTDTKVLSVTRQGVTKRVLVSRGGTQRHTDVDEILIATGHAPNVDLGLENASVLYTDKGIVVNKHLRTSVKHIYAAGDVLGGDSRTHSSVLESRVAAHNILEKAKITPDYTATPLVVFSTPEIAHVGLTEAAAHTQGKTIKKALVPMNVIGRSNVADYTDGFVKLIVDEHGILVGGTIVAPHAGELIHEIALAVKARLTAQQVADTPHAFLSWSEAIRVAATKLR